MLIILEGPDKAGKSTIYQHLRRATSYQPLVIDRFIGSNIVYDQVHGRKEADYTKEEWLAIEERLKSIFRPVVVFLKVPTSILLQRSVKAGDYNLEGDDIRGAKVPYDEYLGKTSLPVIEINTSNSIQHCVKTILREINDMEERDVWNNS